MLWRRTLPTKMVKCSTDERRDSAVECVAGMKRSAVAISCLVVAAFRQSLLNRLLDDLLNPIFFQAFELPFQ